MLAVTEELTVARFSWTVPDHAEVDLVCYDTFLGAGLTTKILEALRWAGAAVTDPGGEHGLGPGPVAAVEGVALVSSSVTLQARRCVEFVTLGHAVTLLIDMAWRTDGTVDVLEQARRHLAELAARDHPYNGQGLNQLPNAARVGPGLRT